MIDKFIARSKAFNRIAAEGARDLGIPLLFVDEDIDPAKLAERCLASMQSDWL